MNLSDLSLRLGSVIYQLCDSGKSVHLSEPLLSHLRSGENDRTSTVKICLGGQPWKGCVRTTSLQGVRPQECEHRELVAAGGCEPAGQAFAVASGGI